MRRGQHFPWDYIHEQQDHCLLLALGPREKKEVGYANNKFFLVRAALCTGGKVITLGESSSILPSLPPGLGSLVFLCLL